MQLQKRDGRQLLKRENPQICPAFAGSACRQGSVGFEKSLWVQQMPR